MAEESKSSNAAQPQPQWRSDELRNAMQMFNGRSPNDQPQVDTTPNRGSGWLGKR